MVKKTKNKERYVFKINVTAGTKYLQIWEFNDIDQKYVYVLGCGTAEKLYKKIKELVRTDNYENQTKD